MARSAFCLGEGCRSSISSFPSLPFPCRGKNESLSQQLASVIPQYRPGFHSCGALRSDITSPLAFYGHVHCQAKKKGSLMIMSGRIRPVLVLCLCCVYLRVCSFTLNGLKVHSAVDRSWNLLHRTLMGSNRIKIIFQNCVSRCDNPELSPLGCARFLGHKLRLRLFQKVFAH